MVKSVLGGPGGWGGREERREEQVVMREGRGRGEGSVVWLGRLIVGGVRGEGTRGQRGRKRGEGDTG